MLLDTSRSATRVFLLESLRSCAAQRLSTSSSICTVVCFKRSFDNVFGSLIIKVTAIFTKFATLVTKIISFVDKFANNPNEFVALQRRHIIIIIIIITINTLLTITMIA